MSFTEVMDAFGSAVYGDGYESRPEQAQLGEAIGKSFGDNVNLLAEAPTGTGKSYGALIPAAEWAMENDSRVVVATATKALQDQYAADLPLLADHSGLDFRYALLKGRGNYVCRMKLKEVGDQYPGLLEELDTEDQTGDFDGLVTPLPVQARSQLTTSSEECPGKRDCPFGQVCFAEAAKERAEAAHVIVVNHSVLVIDVMMRAADAALLPDYGRLIIDEAHNLEDYATSALGKEISSRSAKDFADQALTLLKSVVSEDTEADDSRAKALLAANDALFDKIKLKLRAANESSVAMDDALLLEFENELVAVVEAAYRLREQIKFINTEFARDEVIGSRKRLMKRSASMISNFTSLVPAEDIEGAPEPEDEGPEAEPAQGAPFTPIRWIKTEERAQRGGGTVERVTLNFAPLNVGPLLDRYLWAVPGRSAVLMSATLSVSGDFSYIASRLGLREYRKFTAPSPFDYRDQSRIFVPAGADPSKGRSGWNYTLHTNLVEMAEAAGGRALFLFTSRKSMRETHQAIAGRLEGLGLRVLMQGEGMPNPAIIAEKKAFPEVVVFALKSFMEGVNIPGEALQLVVVDKLPFPSPGDIIFAARCEAVNQAHNDSWASFNRLSVPMMSLVLQQAVGRLIRTKTDRGLVAVMDGRMHPQSGGCSKPYGRTVFKSLTGGPFLDSIDEAISYLRELRS